MNELNDQPSNAVLGVSDAQPQVASVNIVSGKTQTPDALDTLEDSSFFVPEEPVRAPEQEQGETLIDLEAMVTETQRIIENTEAINLEKMPMSIPLSDAEKLLAFQQREILKNINNIAEVARDVTGAIQSVNDAQRIYSSNFKLLMEALQRITARMEKEKPLSEVLKRGIGGIGDGVCNPFNRYKGKENVDLEGSTGLSVITSLTGGGMRRVTLWGSGLWITLRKLPLDILNLFYREMNHADYEYGKEYGMFYYLFADLSITKYIIENLLPLVICGSNYVHWRDTDKLLQQISYQDFQVILWAMGLMMHPRGASVNFICAEEGCDHVHTEMVDLSKLRLINKELINEEMQKHFRKDTPCTDADLEEFRKVSNLNRDIVVRYSDGYDEKIWTLHLKQTSIFDYRAVGSDYNAELRRRCDPTNATDVHFHTLYNQNRCFKPWIDSVTLTVNDPDGNVKNFTFKNDGTEDMDKAIFVMLDEFQQNAPTFVEQMKQYILDTKIVHICFYFPECPKCHTEPKNSYHGYIPYDPMQAFFTLALMKLLQGASTHDTSSTSANTKTS